MICLGIYQSDGKIQQYIVFRGNQSNHTESELFSNEEKTFIHDHSIPVHYSSRSIYPDDSIYILKQKIVEELKNLNIPLTSEEIYLFFKQLQTRTSFSVFDSILKHHLSVVPEPTFDTELESSSSQTPLPKEEITAMELAQLMTNYGLNISQELEEKIRHSIANPDLMETFSFDDWKTLWPWDNQISRFHSLGLSFPSLTGEDPLFSAHPFLLHYEYLKKQVPIAMNTMEGELLMNCIPEMAVETDTQSPKTIHLWLASTENVLRYFQEKTLRDVSEIRKDEELLALYYPQLFHNHQIRSWEDWQTYHSQPLPMPKSIPETSLELFYDLYSAQNTYSEVDTEVDIPYQKRGITSFLFSIPSEMSSIQIPLEYVFRQMTATKETPYIQYNPGAKQEVLYRLYSEKMAQNGKKIPYLNKDVLKKWAKQIRNKKRAYLTLAIFPQPPSQKQKLKRTSFQQKHHRKWSGDLFLRIYPNGEMEIEGNPQHAWEASSLESTLIETLHPIIRTLNRWIQSSGYTLPLFESWIPVKSEENVFDSEIEIKESSRMKIISMNYQWQLEVSQVLLNQLETYRPWLSSAFYYTSDWKETKMIEKKGGPTLTFRRVGHFQSMETENQWIAYYVQQHITEEDILERLQTEHSLTREEAVGLYSQYLQEFKTEQRNVEMNIPGKGWKKNQKHVRVKNTHPGFPMTFRFDSLDKCTVVVENICHFTYLNTLQVYVKALEQLSKGLPDTFQKRLNTLLPKSVEPSSFEQAILEEEDDEGIDIIAKKDMESAAVEGEEAVDDEEDTEDEEPEVEYIHSDFSEKRVDYLNTKEVSEIPDAPSVEEEQEQEEPVGDAEEEDAEEEEDDEEEDESSISSELSELHYNEIEEEEEEEKDKEEKGGKNKKPSKKSSKKSSKKEEKKSKKQSTPSKPPAKLEKEILSFLQPPSSSQKIKKAANKKGGVASSFLEPQYKNQNISKYWLERMKTRDPGLFEMYAAKEKEIPNFKAYSRTCQINDQRQPVLINEEEKQRIDREHPGSYTYALPYKSNPEAPEMYYICPRYWCFKTGTSMTEEEVQQGKCGPPENAVPSNFSASEATRNRDTSLVHFNDKKQHHDPQGNYVENNPGFIKRDGICMPCCFKRARPEVSCEQSRQVGEYTSNDYIITDESKRLEPMKWGILPIALQTYFQYFPNWKETMDGKRLKLHKPMLLRYGVEQFPNQSFLGVMADWYTAIHKLEETITVKEFREVMASAITLDQFLQYHNGSLVTAFRASPLQKEGAAAFPSETSALITTAFSTGNKVPSTQSTGGGNSQYLSADEVDYTSSKYAESQFVKRIGTDTEAKRAIINDTIASYENYLQFLRDPTAEIDPTYLWDIINIPNPLLFPKGLNLVLLSLPENDMTQNVDFICPSMVYSSQIFDVHKDSAIVLLHHGFYEPIYVLERTDKDKERTTKFFLSKNSSVLGGVMNRILHLIRKTVMSQCSPKPSIKSYTFERPMYLSDLVNTLKKMSSTYQMIAHVWNYSGKIIGLQVAPYPQTESKPKSIVVPCFPTAHSPLSSKHEANRLHRFIDDKELWMDLPTTLRLLRKLNKDSKEMGGLMTTTDTPLLSIPCIPVIELVEEEMIIGVMTQTNQFIAIHPPVAYQPTTPPPAKRASLTTKPPMEKDLNTELLVLHSTNYLQADIAVSTAPRPDPERERWIRDIRLENKFYTVFRSTVRLELNRYENRQIRKQIIQLIQRYQQGREKYRTVLNQFVSFLQSCLKNVVTFMDFDEGVIEELYRLSKEQDFIPCAQTDSENPEPYCLYSSKPSVLSIEKESVTEQKGGNGRRMEEGVWEKGKLLIPKKNRVNESGDNEVGYYLRTADEMIRFPRIQNYLLFPTSFLSVQNAEYNIKPSELILLQSILVPENVSNDYFKDLKPTSQHNAYVQKMPYEMSEPIQTIPYSNTITANDPLQKKGRNPSPPPLSDIKEPQTDTTRLQPTLAKADIMEMELDEIPETNSPTPTDSQDRSQSLDHKHQRMIQEFQTFYDDCVAQTVQVIGSTNNSSWKRMFPKSAKELIYRGTTPNQSFCCIMNLIYSYLKRPLPLLEMKKQLIEAYRPWMNDSDPVTVEYKKKIIKLLSKYNSALVKQWKRTGDWESMFLNEDYLFTDLDLWVVANDLQLPVVLFTSNSLRNLFPYREGVPPVKWLLLYPHRLQEKHYFIRPPSTIEPGNAAPSYHKIEPAMTLNNLKDVVENPLSIEEQVKEGLENSSSPYAVNVMSLETYLSTPF